MKAAAADARRAPSFILVEGSEATSSGRPVGATLTELPNGWLLLTDAGEAWAERVARGYADPVPSPEETARLAAVAQAHGVVWDAFKRSFVGVARSMEEAYERAKGIVAAVLAVDGWSEEAAR